MQVYTEEFTAMKIALGIIERRTDELSEREKRLLLNALVSVRAAELRLKEANKKQARYMKRRRSNH